MLNANRLSAGERFTQEDLAVLRLFAGTAALAIDQTSLLQRTQARSRSLDTLLSIGEAFAGGAEAATALFDVLPRVGAAFHPSQTVAFLGPGDDGDGVKIGGRQRSSNPRRGVGHRLEPEAGLDRARPAAWPPARRRDGGFDAHPAP